LAGGLVPRGGRWSQGGAALLADAYPGRHLLGLGFGDARPGTKPLATVSEYLDEMDAMASVDPFSRPPAAREHLHMYFTTKYNVAKFLRLGYTEADIDGGRGSDRLVDDLVIWGDLDTIARKLHDHLEAGADHVCIQVLGVEPGTSAMPHWRRLAEALLPQRATA
jgi:alkanesulfonate monooxygenase SsuD/methylene tetrahydromethanopterin reductase-like flavin-dependent oxidoreductase (luciferase family)